MNIGAAASPRAATILDWLEQRGDDVLVLTETSSGSGSTLLRNGLKDLGYTVAAPDCQRDRGVLLASRVPVLRKLDESLSVTLPWRVSGAVLDTLPRISILGVYVPSRDRSKVKVVRKEQFIESFLASLCRLPARLRNHLLIAGDYNVIGRDHDPPRRGFFSYEYSMLDVLADHGFAPAHTLCSNPIQPHSWIGRTGNGYLYDYIHVGASMHQWVNRCTYLHSTREQRLTDHAAVSVECKVGPASPLDRLGG